MGGMRMINEAIKKDASSQHFTLNVDAAGIRYD